MKAVIEFDLPEESEDFKIFNNSRELYSVLWDIKQEIRNELKHGNPKDPEFLEKLRDLIPYHLLE